MSSILFDINHNSSMAQALASSAGLELGKSELRKFPDGETYVRLLSDVKEKDVVLFCTLNEPDQKILNLLFFCRLLKEADARKITLLAPYLPFMRQDKKFNEGEGITSIYFAELLSAYIDELITIDPHLHRFRALSDLYRIPTATLHATDIIAHYVQLNIKNALVIGPDSESAQWVEDVASKAGIPHLVLQKQRLGDKQVNISVPQLGNYRDRTPVILDDIASTARTMIETVKHLNEAGTLSPVCIAVHPVFAGNAYENLKAAGAREIVSCNTILHASNKIDITPLMMSELKKKERRSTAQ